VIDLDDILNVRFEKISTYHVGYNADNKYPFIEMKLIHWSNRVGSDHDGNVSYLRQGESEFSFLRKVCKMTITKEDVALLLTHNWEDYRRLGKMLWQRLGYDKED
jgi:hypothetical protein